MAVGVVLEEGSESNGCVESEEMLWWGGRTSQQHHSIVGVVARLCGDKQAKSKHGHFDITTQSHDHPQKAHKINNHPLLAYEQ